MTPPAERQTARPWAALVGGTTLVAAVAFMAHASYRALREHYTVPTVDDWRILDGFFSQPLGSWLVEGQNGHRMPGTQLLLALDYAFLGGHMHLLTAASVACAWLAFAAACIPLRSQPARVAWLPVLAFTGYALFWAGTSYDFVWGTNQGSQQATLLLFVALALLAVGQARRLEGYDFPAGVVVGAVLAAAGATFSQGVGVAAWAALLAVAIVGRFPWRVTVAVVVAALATVAAYGVGLATPYGPRLYLTLLTTRALSVLSFVASFVGIAPNLVAASWAHADPHTLRTGFRSGTAGLVGLTLYVLWLGLRRVRLAPPEGVALGLMTFVPVGGLLAAMHRLPWGMAGEVRWVTWSTLFWIGAAWAVGDLVMRRAPRSCLLAATFAGVVVCTLPALREARHQKAVIRRGLEMDAQILVLGIRSDGAVRLSPMLAHDDVIYRVTKRFRRDRRGFFADSVAALPGAPLEEHFAPAPAGRCRGYIFQIDRLVTHGAPAVRLLGHWDTAELVPPSLIVMTDSNGRIQGLGMPQTWWQTGAGDHPWMLTGDWVGHLQNPQPTDRYVVRGVLADGRSVCPLAELSGAEALAAPLAPPPADLDS